MFTCFSTLIADVNEITVRSVLKLSIGLASAGLSYLDLGLLSDIKETSSYLYLVQDDSKIPLNAGTGSLGLMLTLTAILPFIMLVVLQSRIEYDNIRFKDGGGHGYADRIRKFFTSGQVNPANPGQDQDEGVEGIQKLSTVRILVVFGVFTFALVFLHSLIPDQIPLRESALSVVVLSTVIVPYGFILKHDGMKKLARARITSLLEKMAQNIK